MSNISEFSLTRIVSGIKKKDFTSEEVTRSFINNSKKSKKLNTYITECFDQAIQSAKNFDKKKIIAKNISDCKKQFSFNYEVNDHIIRSYYYINIFVYFVYF